MQFKIKFWNLYSLVLGKKKKLRFKPYKIKLKISSVKPLTVLRGQVLCHNNRQKVFRFEHIYFEYDWLVKR